MELFLAELEKRGILAKIKNIREEFEYFCIWKSYLDPLRMMLNSGLASEDILKESKYYVRYISSVFPDASKNKYLSSEDEFVSFARDLLLMEQML